MATTTVTRNGQITIDAEIRRALGIDVGTPLIVNTLGETIVIAKKDPTYWRRHKTCLPEHFERILKDMRKRSHLRTRELFT